MALLLCECDICRAFRSNNVKCANKDKSSKEESTKSFPSFILSNLCRLLFQGSGNVVLLLYTHSSLFRWSQRKYLIASKELRDTNPCMQIGYAIPFYFLAPSVFILIYHSDTFAIAAEGLMSVAMSTLSVVCAIER